MKSPTLLQSVDTLDFHLLTRKASQDNFQIVPIKKFRRRTSRKNLVIVTLVYAAFIIGLLMMAF